MYGCLFLRNHRQSLAELKLYDVLAGNISRKEVMWNVKLNFARLMRFVIPEDEENKSGNGDEFQQRRDTFTQTVVFWGVVDFRIWRRGSGATAARSVIMWHNASFIQGNKVHHRHQTASMAIIGTLILECETRRRTAGNRLEAKFLDKAINDAERGKR